MRLICPNCGAQYEVDETLVPDAGRDVQCSNCGHGWFQRPAHLDDGLAEELGTALPEAPEPEAEPSEVAAAEAEDAASAGPVPEPEPAPETASAAEPPAEMPEAETPPAGPATLAPEFRSILVEEAERETRARHDETAIETQDDLGLEDPESAAPGVRERMARLRGLDVDDRADSTAAAVAAATAAGSRRDLLPDIEEINSSLRSAEEREDEIEAAEILDAGRRSGFGLGFTVVVLIAVAAIAVYIWADQIATAVPATKPLLAVYVDWADGVRGWLDGIARGWVEKITGMVDATRAGKES
jgi:predicted Zn finger-like uncharacterized protein